MSDNVKNEIPRRIQLDKLSAGERAIHDAKQVIEGMPPHTLLTEATILLSQAQEKVADFVDLPNDAPPGC